MASIHVLLSPDDTQLVSPGLIEEHHLSAASLHVPNEMGAETIDAVVRVLAKMVLHTSVPEPLTELFPPTPEIHTEDCQAYDGLFDRIVTTPTAIWGRRPGLGLWVPLWPQETADRAVRAAAAE
jgi:hypothetical protein